MPRILFLMLLAFIVPSVGRGEDERPTLPPKAEPAGAFFYLEALIDPARARPGAYPPADIAVEEVGWVYFGPSLCLPMVKFRVPAARVPEIQVLLDAMKPDLSSIDDAPPPDKAP
jgi:hypothetical protein